MNMQKSELQAIYPETAFLWVFPVFINVTVIHKVGKKPNLEVTLDSSLLFTGFICNHPMNFTFIIWPLPSPCLPAVVILVQATVTCHHVSSAAFSLDPFCSSHVRSMRMVFLHVNHSMVSPDASTREVESEPFAVAYKTLHSLAFSLPFSFAALLTALWPSRSSCCYTICQTPTLKPPHLLFPLPWTLHMQIFAWLTLWLKSGACSHTLLGGVFSRLFKKKTKQSSAIVSLYLCPANYYLCGCSTFSLTREGVPKGQVGCTVHSYFTSI